MTRTILVLTAALLILPSPPASAQIPEPDPIPAGVAAPPGTYDRPLDVLHYDVELALSDVETWVQGAATIHVRLDEAWSGELGLDFSGLVVDAVQVAGRAVPARLESGVLTVPLSGEAGDRVAVDVAYRGVPDDGLVVGTSLHGDPTAFADNWPNRARFWFPSVDHPSDKATVSFTVHAPAAWKVVANGALQAPPEATPTDVPGPPTSQGRRTWHWQSVVALPTYTMVVGGAEMVVDTVGLAACGDGRAPASPRQDGCIAVTTWLFPADAETAAPSFRRAPAMVDHFTDLVGPFPYEKMANVQSSTRFGGMENASAIFYSERALASGRNIEGTVSHEIAHQWFGDAVTGADWRHIWLSEGFATYFGAQFFEAADGVEDFRRRLDQSRRSYLASDDVDRPVVVPGETDLFALLNRNSYQKGGWVLHMLRGVVGDEVFFRGIRRYYRTYLHGTALSEDLQRIMEEEVGQDLGWFFHQWLHEPGYPALRLEWQWDAGAREVLVTVHQEQSEAWPAFRLPMEIEVRLDDGPRRHRIDVTTRRHTVRLAAPSRPASVILDPDGWVLKRMAEEEIGP